VVRRSIEAEKADELVKSGGVDVVDVREPHEWATGHIPGARLVPLGRLKADPDGARLGSRVLFVCERGGRSQHAAELAEARGVPEVYSLDGGIVGWRAAGLPIETPEAAAVEDIAPELDAVVGANLKELRTKRGYSLDLLAGASGVSRQMLGQIELGHAVASLGTLWKIASALEVPFATLMARPSHGELRIFRSAVAKRIAGTDGRFTSRALFVPEDTGGAFEFYELWLAGHAREDAEAHLRGTRENLVVTSGRLVLEIGKERHELGKGDAIAFTADVPHSYVNPATEECWMNLVMTYPGASPVR
jgi:rhodanese-related sulfurtransferase/transcriptional regulator with XRE-family HTH domain